MKNLHIPNRNYEIEFKYLFYTALYFIKRLFHTSVKIKNPLVDY